MSINFVSATFSADELSDLSLDELFDTAETVHPTVDDVEDPFGNFDALVSDRDYLQS